MQNAPLNPWPQYSYARLMCLRLQVSRIGDRIPTYVFTICQCLLYPYPYSATHVFFTSRFLPVLQHSSVRVRVRVETDGIAMVPM